MSTIAAVKFDETSKPYHFACKVTDLVRGEEIEVETEYAKRSATFIGYTEPEMIGYMPKKTVLGRVGKINTLGNKRKVRSEKERIAEARELRKLLQDEHPIMLSTQQIAEGMDWELDSTSNFVKLSMTLEPKITQVYKGWYTSKL